MSVIPPRDEAGYAEINAPGQSRVGTYAPPYEPGPMPELGETLRVRNVGTDTLRFAWNSRQYVIPPGQEDFMPFDAVKVYTGDPRATNAVRTLRDSIGVVSFLPDRATEVRRLRLLYNAPFGEYMTAQDVGGIFVHTPDPSGDRGWQPGQGYAFEGVRIPQVEVYNIRHQRIYTVLDDPEGTRTMPATITQQQVNQNDQLAALVQQQQSVIEALSDRLGIDPKSGALLNSPDLLDERPEDEHDEPPAESVKDAQTQPVELHEDGSPKIVYDPTSDTVRTKKRPRPADPTTLDDLPEDRV